MALVFCVAPKLLPEIVMLVPTEPEAGETPVITGAPCARAWGEKAGANRNANTIAQRIARLAMTAPYFWLEKRLDYARSAPSVNENRVLVTDSEQPALLPERETWESAPMAVPSRRPSHAKKSISICGL